MKITGASVELPAIPSSSKPQDPPQKPCVPPRKQPRRRIKNSGGGVRVRKDVGGGSQGRRSRPETPLLQWKFNEGVEEGDNACVVAEEVSPPPPENRRKCQRKHRAAVSVRKLAAGLWRLQLPEVPSNGVEKLGFQAGVHHLSVPFHGHHPCKVHDSTLKDQVQSPRSVSGKRDGFLSKLEPSFQFSNTAMEGATKWDPIGWKAAEEPKQIRGHQKRDQQAPTPRVISVLEAELEQARARVQELETERKSSKKKLEQFLKKLSEERAAWRSREHEKIRAILDDMKAELKREMKNRQRLEIVNSKLVNELADAKVSVKRYLQELEKEQKARELIEEVCDELAKEIGEDKAEIEALKRESAKLHEEVDDERKMLQMAEVWREERVQMKLVDAKVTLEDKYSQMNQLIVELESFLRSRGATEDMKEVDQLRQAASDMNTGQEFKYEPPNPGDIFSVLEDVYFAEANEKDIIEAQEDVSMLNKPNFPRHCNELDEEGTEWETISHLDDEQGSSYSPGASDHSLNKNCQLSDGDGKPPVDIQNQQLKMSSISRLWRSRPSNGQNYKIISLEGIKAGMSPGLSPSEQWSSPDSSGHPHLTRGMKGCIEWPRNSQKSSLKAKLLEARMESQKIQLRHVLKQKI
ncbi:PREDICTED: eukaryotic translation initiation factor 5B-like isoform X2 [Ipomoea nil]|uniref:eukaryotic translation initiation factor 5B-like isoform X2 n=1 Tax=Ipomoea nil TaxID=35883 RepID=UPI000901C908|nr:PREDICTED: eukaryotic translation initiation factor 5B-like isoform X2 [Ipomoea nil]